MSVLVGGSPTAYNAREQVNRHDRRVEAQVMLSQRHAADLAGSGSLTTHADGQFLVDLAERIKELAAKVTGTSQS